MVNTFVPFSDMRESIRVLDNKRLGKQRVEAFQILKALAGKTKGWVHHPATQMWRGYEDCLRHYLNLCIEEWTARGFENNMLKHRVPVLFDYPWWWGKKRMHLSHRLNLLDKSPEHYARCFEEKTPPNKPDYLWPNNLLRKLETLTERRQRRKHEIKQARLLRRFMTSKLNKE